MENIWKAIAVLSDQTAFCWVLLALYTRCFRHYTRCFRHYTRCFHHYTRWFEHYTRCFQHYTPCIHHYTRCFQHYTWWFEHYTRCFHHYIRWFEHYTRWFEHYTRWFEHYTWWFEHYTRWFEHYTRCFQHYSRWFKHYTRCFRHYTRCFHHYTRCFQHYTWWFEHYTQCFHHYTRWFEHYTRCFHHYTLWFEHYTRCFHHYTRSFQHYTRCFQHYTRCFQHYTRWFKHYTRCFHHYTHLHHYVAVSQYVWTAVNIYLVISPLACFKMAFEIEQFTEIESILRKLKLDYSIERFKIEKITNEFKELGVQNRGDIMALRMECSKYGSNRPSRSTPNECGAPMFEIPRSVLECYLEQNLTIEEISKILSVSKSTIYRRMRQYGLSKMEFSNITNDELDQVLSDITKEFPHSGEGLVKQVLIGRKIKVQRWRLCESLHRADSEGIAQRKRGRLSRRVYSVQGISKFVVQNLKCL